MSASEPAVIVKDIKKSFRIPLDKTSGIKQLAVNVFKRRKGYREFEALKGVSFEIKKGEFFGIVGRNGSGKSTLLKILAGVYSPDSGGVAINGSLIPFIELGVGFNPELSGRENVFLNGALLGFSRKEMDSMYDDIVNFAELHDFMEERLKNYSSGMQVRLAFSIAIRANTDILLLDEVLAVGDEAFQQKCINYFEQLKLTGKTVVLVTHSMDSVKRFCDRALLLEKGKVKLFGETNRIANQYLIDNSEPTTDNSNRQNLDSEVVEKFECKVISPRILKSGENLKVSINFRALNEFTPMFGIAITSDGKSIAEQNSQELKIKEVKAKQTFSVTFDMPIDSLNPGQYGVDLAVFDKKGHTLKAYNVAVSNFIIEGRDSERGGALKLEGAWHINAIEEKVKK